MKRLPVYLLLIFGAIVFLVPFLWTMTTSLKSPEQAYAFPPQWIPSPAHWDNFQKAWSALPFPVFVRNTVLVSATATFGAVLSASLVAYGFARFEFRGRTIMFYALLSTMMLPSQVTMIPVFLIWRQLRAIDTFAPLIVPSFLGGGAFTVFLLRQFFMSIPRDFDEAAMLDGAGFLRIWWSVLMPLAKPSLVTATLLSFLAHWDEFMGPLIYLNSPENYTMSVGLRLFQDSYGRTSLPELMAASLIHIAPTLVLFFMAQKYFVRGINLAGLGGR